MTKLSRREVLSTWSNDELIAYIEGLRASTSTAEADLERRLGIALHQRDVWRQAHDQLAREVGPNGQAEHWRERYEELAAQVGAMHGGEGERAGSA